MADRATLEIIDTGADAHDAAQAWRTFSGAHERVDRIDVLKESSKTGVFRLHGATRNGAAIIAKRRLHEAIAHERMIYDEVLPTLPVSSLACYGSLTGEQETSWIFLEDSGGRELSFRSEAQLGAATRWLAGAHVAASARAELSRLPDRGPRHYLDHLLNGRDTLGRHINNPAIDAGEVMLLRDTVSLLTRIETRWAELETFCALMPQTFPHGDFVQKNVHVRESRGDITVLPLDWETSGWGVPAVDLEKMDVGLYWSIVRDAWPSFAFSDAQRMVTLGKMFRFIAAIDWEAPSFGASWVKRSAAKVALYNERLSLAMRAWGLA